MKLYDDVIRSMLSLLPQTPDKAVPYSDALCAAQGDKNALLFRSDTAFELGGSGKAAVESVVFGDLPAGGDTVFLYGKDLCALQGDTPFAHLTFLTLNSADDSELRYERLKDIGFSVFQLYPAGYHIRISPSACREQVRVAKAALEGDTPLSFINVGCSLIRQFKAHPDVAAVKTVFITAPDVDYTALAACARKAKAITDAVQKTLQLDTLDCASCKMKPICDEVEGLRELHFKQEKERTAHGT